MSELQAKSGIIERLLVVADAFCCATGRTRASLSKTLFGRGGQIDYLASGLRDLTTKSAEDALTWLSENWPAEAEWPADIARPAAGPAASQAGAGTICEAAE